jgi:hypothetical protein
VCRSAATAAAHRLVARCEPPLPLGVDDVLTRARCWLTARGSGIRCATEASAERPCRPSGVADQRGVRIQHSVDDRCCEPSRTNVELEQVSKWDPERYVAAVWR